MTSTKYDKTPKEQIRYANMLFYGCWGGLALMTVTFLLYVSGILSPHVPMEVILQKWSKPVGEYLAAGNVPTGWGWTGLLGKGDFLNFLGIVLLAVMTLVCYVPLVSAYIKKKDNVFAAIAVAEFFVLAFAASGIVGGGGH